MVEKKRIVFDEVYIVENINNFHKSLYENVKIKKDVVKNNNFMKVKLLQNFDKLPDISCGYSKILANIKYNIDDNLEIHNSLLSLKGKKVNVIYSFSDSPLEYFFEPRLLNVTVLDCYYYDSEKSFKMTFEYIRHDEKIERGDSNMEEHCCNYNQLAYQIKEEDYIDEDEIYARFYKCPKCENEYIMFGHNYCSNCGVKIEFLPAPETIDENGKIVLDITIPHNFKEWTRHYNVNQYYDGSDFLNDKNGKYYEYLELNNEMDKYEFINLLSELAGE